MTTDEYFVVSQEFQFNRFLLSVYNGQITEQYVLLVHRDSGIERIEDLRGRTLAVFKNARMSLAPIWLDVRLIEAGFSGTTGFCGHVTPISKLSQTVLKVFFRQIDACLVTRRGFETMNELNPQLGQQLKVLVESPELVPTVFCCRADLSLAVKDQLLAEFVKVHTTPAGQQVLTIFQSDQLTEGQASCLDSALELRAKHDRLCGVTNRVAAGVRVPAQTAEKVPK